MLRSTVDEEIAAPILAAFERSTDQAVGVVSRFEDSPSGASKLMSEIIAGQEMPPCDVVWNDDVLETVRLQKEGLLAPREWPVDTAWPVDMKARDGSWCGFAATARVLLIDTKQITDSAEYPRSVLALGDDAWSGRCAVAAPTNGKSATHFAVLRNRLGHEATLLLLKKIREQAIVVGDERQVVAAVANGQAAWGLTNSDAAVVVLDARPDLAIIYPDQASSEFGTLRIPNTVAVLGRTPHPVAAALLADYLVDPATEERLAMGSRSQLPLSREATFPPRALTQKAVRWMTVDFETAGAGFDSWRSEVQAIFSQ